MDDTHQKQALLLEQQTIFSCFTVFIIMYLTVFSFLLKFMADLLHFFGTAAVITDCGMLLLLSLFVFFVKKLKFPASFFGLTFENGWRATREAVVFSLPIVALLTLIKWLIILYIPTYSDDQLFELWKNVTSKTYNPSAVIWIAFSYVFISSVAQEIFFRGGLQSFLQFFLKGKHAVFFAILSTSFIFATMHLVFSIKLALLAGLLSLFWGWMYARQKTVVGVILSHIFIGGWAFFILGVQKFVITS